jgi:hypothetical protein
MMRRLYPVWGYTGEYEDYSRWVVGLFPYERSAEVVAEMLRQVVETHGLLVHPSYAAREDDSPGIKALKEAGDLNAHCDYTGMGYRVGTPVRQFVDAADFKMTGHRP